MNSVEQPFVVNIFICDERGARECVITFTASERGVAMVKPRPSGAEQGSRACPGVSYH